MNATLPWDKQMTPKQLEAAAHELCRLRDLNPDRLSDATGDTHSHNAQWELAALQRQLDSLAVGVAVRELVPLSEWNDKCRAAAHAALASHHEPRPNGIACPGCACELVDSPPSDALTIFPAQKRIACPSCGWTGTRIA